MLDTHVGTGAKSMRLAGIGEVRAVLTSSDDGHARFFLLRVSSDAEERQIAHGPWWVRGRFDVLLRVNAAPRARRAWRLFGASADLAEFQGWLGSSATR